MASHAASALQSMNEIRQNDELCDFTVKVQGQNFRVHRLVLSSSSEYFRRMFATEMRENCQQYCEVQDFEIDHVKQCIDFMYGEDLNLNMNNIEKMIKLCDMWLLYKAKEICTQYLVSNIDKWCIDGMALARLYDLKGFLAASYQYIVDNLKKWTRHNKNISLEDMLQILNLGEAVHVQIAELWLFVKHWLDNNENLPRGTVCSVIQRFPSHKLTISECKQTIWRHEHVQNCEICNVRISEKVLNRVEADFTNNAKDTTNLLFIRRMAKSLKRHNIEQSIDEILIYNHEILFEDPEFIEIEKSDLIKYVKSIDKSCRKVQFSSIVSWLKNNPDYQGEIFPILFETKEESDKMFSKCLKTFEYKTSKESLHVLYSLRRGSNWLLSDDDCIYMKQLSKKCGCENAEKRIDSYIVDEFGNVSKRSEFFTLDKSDIVRYLSTRGICLNGAPVVWGAVKNWIEYDLEERRGNLAELFAALDFSRISSHFLRETICEYELIKGSLECMNILMKIVLDKFEKQEKRMEEISTRLNRLEKKIGKSEVKSFQLAVTH